MAAQLVSSHLLHRIEVGDLLAHNWANASNLGDTLELEGQAVARDDIRPTIVVAATRPDICAVALLELQRDWRGWHQIQVFPVSLESRQNPG